MPDDPVTKAYALGLEAGRRIQASVDLSLLAKASKSANPRQIEGLIFARQVLRRGIKE